MGKIRFGYSDDFTAKNSSVGINTTEPQQNLDVIGVVKGKDLAVPGISSLTAYEGFLRADYQVAENTTLRFDQGSSASLSGEIIVGTGQTVTVSKVEDEFANANDGTVWSTYLSNSAGGFQDAYPASNAFNGKISTTETSRSVNSQITSTWTPPKEIKYSSSVEVWTYYAGSVSLNGGTAITVNNDQSWRKIGSGSGTLTSITFSSNSGNDVYIAGIAIDGEILVDGFSTLVDKGARAGGSEVECLKVFNTFTPPSGGTNERPYKPKPGELYYNYDFKTIEFHDGYGWRQVDNTTKSGRAVFGGGYTPGPVYINQMEYVNINTLGNSQYFGDLLGRIAFAQACGSGIRGLYAGDRNPESTSPIEYITIASAGNSIDFGELSAKAEQPGGSCSSSTRGIWGGRSPSPGAQSNVIDYVEINTLGNAVDFGDLKDPSWGTAAVGSTVRGVFVTGSAPSPGYSGELTYITIASKGNSVRFGDLTQRRMTPARGSNSSGRGVLAGGSSFNTIDYITISTEGNATYFGDLSEVLNNAASCGVSGRMIRFGGITPSSTNTIEYVVISTTGNALDFGDCSQTRSVADATSDSHGGLGGF